MIAPSPTVRRWELAARLRTLRDASGQTLEQVSEATQISVGQLSRLETNKRGASPRDVLQLGQYYGLDQAEISELVDLSKQAREAGWWQRFHEIDRLYSTYVGLEAAAGAIDQCSRVMIPGLFQTPEYTIALLRGLRPRGDHSEHWLVEQVDVRERRQQSRLIDQPVVINAILDETVLHRRIGGSAVMKQQLERLIEWSELPSVNLLLVPFRAGSYPGMDGEFSILTFDPIEMTDVVYVEGLLGQFFLSHADDIARYRAVFRASTDAALDAAASRQLIEEVAKTFN